MCCPGFLNTPGPVPCVRQRFDRWCVRRYNPAMRSPFIPSCVILLRGRASSLPDPPNPREALSWRVLRGDPVKNLFVTGLPQPRKVSQELIVFGFLLRPFFRRPFFTDAIVSDALRDFGTR
jgi:hypothetical protein